MSLDADPFPVEPLGEKAELGPTIDYRLERDCDTQDTGKAHEDS